MNNKVIYLNEDLDDGLTQSNTAGEDTQFENTTQFGDDDAGETDYSAGGGSTNLTGQENSANSLNQSNTQTLALNKENLNSLNNKNNLSNNKNLSGGNVNISTLNSTDNGNNSMNNMNNMNGGDSEDLNEILDDEQSNISEGSDVNSIHEGGDGEGDGEDAMSNSSSLNTHDILELDPMYIRLTKFLQTGGDNNKNLADILLDISNNFSKLNENLENFNLKMSKLSLQQ